MSTTVDNRVVEMQFNNSQFESNVKTSLNTIAKLKESLNFSGVADSFESITSSSEKVDMSGISNAIESVHVKFSALEVVALTALSNITNSVIEAGKQFISSLSVDNIAAGWEKFAEKTQSVGTLISQGYDLETVNEQLERLNWYTDETSYNFTDMVSNIAKFTASGQSLETSVTAMEGIANWAALSGQNATTASRAMYQLSQAMSSGYMRLEDYKSIQNASMDTEEFRQKCIDAALALGTLQENADGTYTSIVDGATATTFTLSSFTTGLTQGAWLTSDVMMDVFNEYSGAVDQIYEYATEQGITASEAIEELGESIDEFGLKAFKAAQEARSWADVVDSVKDAVSTGWMNTFEIIFGNYEEATELWTDLANALYDVFAAGAEDRNEMLETWKELGGRTVLIDAFWTAWENVGEILSTVKEAFRDVFPSVTAEKLYSITERIKKFADSLKLSDDTLAKLKSTFKGVFAVLDIAKQAIYAVSNGVKTAFGSMGNLADGALDLASSFGDWLVRLDESIKKSNIFNRIVNKITGAIKKVADIISQNSNSLTVSFWEGGGGLPGVIEVVFDKIADLVRIINDLTYAFTGIDLSAFSEGVVGAIQNIRNKVVNFVSDITCSFEALGQGLSSLDFAEIKENIKGFITAAKEKFATPGLNLLKDAITKISELIGDAITAVIGLNDTTSSAFREMGNTVSNCTFVKVLSAIWNGIVTVASAITNLLGGAARSLISAIGNADLGAFFSTLNDLLAGGVLVGIIRLINNFATGIGSVSSFVKELKDGTIDILDNFGSVLESWSTSIKADAILKIAGAVAILAISLIALTGIDSEKLSASITAITSLCVDLVAAMAILQKTTGATSIGPADAITNFVDSFSNAKLYSNMIKMAAAVGILAAALALLASVDQDNLGSALTAITGLFADLTVSMIALSKFGGATSGLTAIVGMATAIYILTSAIRSLSELSWNEITNGLVAVTTLCAEMTVAMIGLSKFGGSTKGAVAMIALAAAIKILASACENFAEMSWEEIAKGLTSVGVLLTELTAFTALSGNANKMISTGLAMISFAAAMKIFASAVSDFGELSLATIGKGLISIGFALAEVAVAAKLMPQNMLSLSAGMLIMGAALEIIANVFGKMGGMSWEGIAKGLVSIGIALAEVAIALNLMKGTASGSAALLIAASAIAVLTPALKSLGSMSIAAIAQSLITLAAAFTIIGVAASVLSPVTTSILALSGAFALIGVGVAAVGVGLVAAGAGIASIAVGITALASSLAVSLTAIVSGIETIILAIVALIPNVLIALGEGIVGICDVLADGAPSVGDALKAIILALVDVLVECVPALASGALEMLLGVTKSLVEYAPQIVDALVQMLIGIIEAIAENIPDLVLAVMDLLGALFGAIVDAINGLDTDALLSGIVCVGLLSALVVALSAIGGLIPAAMVALAGLGVFVAEMAAIFAAIGALAQIPGLTWLIDEGAVLLEGVGNAIGAFVGGIVGGFMSGVTSQFAQIGADLSAFMENVQPFLEGASKIDAATMNGVLLLGEVILVLTAADVINGLTSWFTGGSSLAEFGQELAKFGPYFSKYFEAIKGIDGNVVEASANAALALAEMAGKLPNSGGVAGWFAGENSLSVFAEELAEFGPSLKAYADSVNGLDTDVVVNSANAALVLAEMASELPNQNGIVSWFTGDNPLSVFGAELATFGYFLAQYASNIDGVDADIVIVSANAASVLAEMANNLPNQNGLLAWFTGENTLSAFGLELVAFGLELREYSKSIEGFDSEDVMNSANAGKALLEMADNLPKQGGIVSWITGDNTLSNFGKELAKFGPYLAEYATSVEGMSTGVVANSANAAKVLAALANDLPNNGGIVSWFTGDNDLATFGEKLVSFGQSFARYYDNISEIKLTVLSGVTSEFQKIIDIASGISKINASGMSNFAKDLAELGNSGIDEFLNAFKGANSKIASAVSEMLAAFTNEVTVEKTKVIASFLALVQAIVAALKVKISEFKTVGSSFLSNLVAGAKTQDSKAQTALAGIVDKCITAIKNKYDDFYNVGKYLAEGFASGIAANTNLAVAKSKTMASSAANAAAQELDEHSPSKVGYQIGDYFGVSFVNAISDYAGRAYSAATDMASSAQSGLSTALSAVSDIIETIDSNIEDEFTIHPVLDLTDIAQGVNEIDTLFQSNRAMDLAMSTNVGAGTLFTSNSDGLLVNDNSDVVTAIASLRSDVASLSSAISNLKIVMDTGALVGSLTSPMNIALGRQAAYEGRGI